MNPSIQKAQTKLKQNARKQLDNQLVLRVSVRVIFLNSPRRLATAYECKREISMMHDLSTIFYDKRLNILG